MKPIAPRKKILLVAFVLGGVGLVAASAALYAIERGPFVCNNGCLVQSPLIDAATEAFLDSVLAPIDRVPMAMYASGTTYMICNATHCTTYRKSFTDEYIGSNRTPIEGGGSPPGGGDPPPPPPGGHGGGSCESCHGQFGEVGPIEPVP